MHTDHNSSQKPVTGINPSWNDWIDQIEQQDEAIRLNNSK